MNLKGFCCWMDGSGEGGMPPGAFSWAPQFGQRRGPGVAGGFGRQNFWSDWFGSPPPRAERGGVRYLVLDAIAERPRHGYEVISAIEEKSSGAYRPSPGVIYPTLQLLDELKHASSTETDGRRIYQITDTGRADLAAHRHEVDDFYDRTADDSWETQIEGFAEVARHLARLARTFRRAARRGQLSSTTVTRVREVIDDAIQRLERILESER